MANEAAAPSATADPGVTLTDPIEQGDGINRESQAAPVEIKTDPQKPDGVDLKVWAKTSAENRQLKSDMAKLKGELELAQKAGTPEAVNSAVLEALKKPETIKLLKQSGHTIDQIFEVYKTDEDAEDPKELEQRKRIEVLEEKLKLRDESEEKAKKDAIDRVNSEAIASSMNNITSFVDKNEDSIDDDEDPRNGTPRWVLVKGDKVLLREAHDLVVDFITSNKIPEEKQGDAGRKLLLQALDKLEIRERNKIKPQVEKIKKLEPKLSTIKDSNWNNRPKTVVDKDWRPKQAIPTLQIDRAATSGPAPVKVEKKRFSSGPTQVKFSS